jgi:hypothetical protein
VAVVAPSPEQRRYCTSTQPGLTHQVHALEELGGLVVGRLPRAVRLTPAGRTALPHARASLAHSEGTSSAARRASGVETGELQVGKLVSISVGVRAEGTRNMGHLGDRATVLRALAVLSATRTSGGPLWSFRVGE